uniref:Uncharacterized protein n=1 Tax=Panagrolaimus sp. JU765 TaxID=591449 RepID=A0AC34QU27_9BILA
INLRLLRHLGLLKTKHFNYKKIPRLKTVFYDLF